MAFLLIEGTDLGTKRWLRALLALLEEFGILEEFPAPTWQLTWSYHL